MSELLLLVRLLAAHLVVDFVLPFRPRAGTHRPAKRGWRWRCFHGAVASGLTYLFAGAWQAVWLIPVIFAAHALLHSHKAGKERQILACFLEQMGLVAVAAGCWLVLIPTDGLPLIDYHAILAARRFWIIGLAYLVVIWPASVLLERIMARWQQEIRGLTTQGLPKAGLWIGRLERALILTFFLMQRFEAIGFLIAAKSVFRFGEVSKPERRKEAEYILIGTMLSFLIAIVTGIAATWMLGLI